MKKYISLEHAIRKAVAEQNYKKKALDESISPVDYDKPKEVPQAFFKPVHIQPRKGEDQIPASGPVRSRRNYEKEKSSETMHPNLKNEETVDEAALLARIATGAIATKEIIKRTAPKLADDIIQAMARTIKGEKKPTEPAKPEQKPEQKPESPTAPAAEPPIRPFDVPPNNLPAVVPPKTTPPAPAPSRPAPDKAVPAPTTPAPAPTTPAPTKTPTKTEPVPAEVIPAPATQTRTQTRTETLPQIRTRTQPKTKTPPPNRGKPGLSRRLFTPDIGGGGAAPTTPEIETIFGRSHVPSRISIPHKRRKAHFEETRYDIKNVARPEDNRDEEIVGRPKSPKSKYTKQAEIIRKVVEEQKIIIKKDKEEKMGKNPLVDTEPKLKHHTLDQESVK